MNVVRRCVAAGIVMALCSMAAPANAARIDGNRLKGNLEAPPYSSAYDAGFFYFMGALDGAFYSGTVCPSDGVTNGQLLAIFKKYLADHPERLHLWAPILIEEALTNLFPCQRRK